MQCNQVENEGICFLFCSKYKDLRIVYKLYLKIPDMKSNIDDWLICSQLTQIML